MVFLARNDVRVFPVIVLAILKALCISARPVPENSSNPANARRYTEHVPPIGSDTFNPGTLSHPATIAVDPLESILDESGLGTLDGHDEGSSNTDEGEGPLDEIANLKSFLPYYGAVSMNILSSICVGILKFHITAMWAVFINGQHCREWNDYSESLKSLERVAQGVHMPLT